MASRPFGFIYSRPRSAPDHTTGSPRRIRQEERPISRKARVLLGGLVLIAIPLILLLVVFRSNLGSDQLRHVAQAELERALGGQLVVDSLQGNPLRGYRASGISIEREGQVLASGEGVEIHLSLRSLLAGRVTISLLRLRGLSFDISCLTDPSGRGCPTLPQGIRRLEVISGRLIASGSEVMAVDRATWDGQDNGAVVEAEGRFMELPFKTKLRLIEGKGTLSLDEGSLSLGKSRLELAGSLAPLALSGRALPLDMAELAFLFPDVTQAGLVGRADVTFALSDELSDEGPSPRLTGTIGLPQGEAVDIALEAFGAQWAWEEDRLLLFEIDGRANGSPVRGSLGLAFSGEELDLAIDMEAEKFDVESWQRAFPWLAFASGSVETLSADLKGPTSKLIGRILLSGADALLVGQRVETLGAELLLDERGIIALSGQGLWADSPFDVAGTVALDEATTLDLHFATTSLALHRLRAHFGWLDPLLPEGNLAGDLTLRGPAAAPVYGGMIRSDQIRVRKSLIENLSALFSIRGSDVVIEKASGQWQGATFEAAGTIGQLFETGNPSLAVAGNVRDLALAELPLNGFDLGGRAKGPWKLAGSLESPELAASLSVEGMAASGIKGGTFSIETGYDGRTLTLDSFKGPLMGGEIAGRGKIDLGKASLKLQGDFSRLPLAEKALAGQFPEGNLSSCLSGGYLLEGPLFEPALTLNVREGTATAWAIPITAVTGRLFLKKGDVTLEKSSLSLLGGKASFRGSLKKGAAPSVEVLFDGLDLAAFPGRDDLTFTVGGNLFGSASLSGRGETLKVEADLSVPTFKLGDFSLSDVSVQAQADRESLEITLAKGQIGTSALEARGSFALNPLRGSLSLAGKELDLAIFASAVDPQKTGGLFDISLDAQIKPERLSATGQLTSPSLRVAGLRIDDLKLPFLILDRYLTIEEGTAQFYGGSVETQWSLGLDEERWGGNLRVKGFDLAPVLADGFDFEGSLSGKTDLKMSLSGTYGRAMLLDGRGDLSVLDGQIEGFSALSKVGGPIPYRALTVNYVIDGKTLYLLPGSRAAAPSGNNLYRYLSFDGNVTPGKDLDIACYGELNLQAFGALLGAISKLVTAEAETTQAMTKGFLSGLLGNVTGRDFREISLSLVGDWGAPVLKDLTVHEAPQRARHIPSGASDPKGQGDSSQFTFRLEFPTGEGVEKGGSEMGSQITQQILDQILIQILGGDDEDHDDGSFFH